MIAVDGTWADEATILGDEQEKETVDQAQQLSVELGRRRLPGGEFLAQLVVGGVSEETVAEQF